MPVKKLNIDSGCWQNSGYDSAIRCSKMSSSTMSESRLQAVIGDHFLFSSLSQQARETLVQHCRTIKLKNDETLFSQGGEAHSFYLALSGAVKLFRVSPDGQTKVIEVIHAGETFAEALMFMDQIRYPVNASAMGSAEVMVIPNKLYKEMLLAAPQSAMKLMGTMAVKLHRRIKEIETLTLQNTRHRLGNYLFGLAPDPAAKQSVFQLPMAKQLIASQLGMQPETFSRLIKEMKTQGLIEVNGAEVQVHDLQGLRAFGH
ncbi:cAMP-binding domain of CRP or a regulatory subunit of cAMP-dependent protein kinases [Amphritea atlantica]|uniref:cAMP-binding domain of CRP or a regulatory subunit of cAMP-dependent protein kinases n=2 Tax=Amphritea atlantica TaxID=355243 RepID=A0A1H9LGE3_9GAMM|nr:cAMP-binding domain of CRP or a regulatory subunit of cAMP-dependent protein kinases [Amphritea atlantica]